MGPQVPIAAAILFVAVSLADAQGPIVGRATVVDGDTIDIRGERIRFDGIDAPESWQKCEDATGRSYPCGRVSALALDAFLALSRPTTCHFRERDRYGRFVGDCYRADGKSIAAWMVRQGHALDWRRYSKGRFAKDQAAAKSAKSGMWRGRFLEPWEARRLRRRGD